MAWFAAMVTLGAGLLARHVLALPGPSGTRLAPGLSSLRRADQRGWLAVHVLYASCRCSQRIAAHLAGTNRPEGVSEIVLWAGDDPPPAALAAAFDVRRVSEAGLAELGVEAAPLLAVVAPSGEVRYAGGYTTRKQGPEVEDLAIIASARRAERLAALPVFGCAVSTRLQEQLSRLPVP